MWLYGAAGAGKSAIAHTVAEICETCGWLMASFFFWKTAGERNNANRFVATIAHQIALSIPASCELIAAAVDYNPFIFEQSVDVQLSKLITEPLEQLFCAGMIFDISPSLLSLMVSTGVKEEMSSPASSSPWLPHFVTHRSIFVFSLPAVRKATSNPPSIQ